MSQDSSLQLPENLGARCSLLYVWDEEYTVRALEGYLQFMELKANFEDWDCDQLAPSVVIDLVWQQHLLYNKQYIRACTDYCGSLIGYDPDISLLSDNASQEQRIKTTKIALKALYGRKYDADVWNFLEESGMNKTAESAAGVSQRSVESSHNDETLNTREDSNKKLPPRKSSPPAAGSNNNNRNQNNHHQHHNSRFDTREDSEAGHHSNSNDHRSSNRSIVRDGTISDSDQSDFRVSAAARPLRHHLNPAMSNRLSHQRNNSNSNNSASNNSRSNNSRSNNSSSNGRQGTRGAASTNNNTTASSSAAPPPSESVTVKIKCFIDGKTQDTCIRVKRTTKMKKVEDCLAKLMNLESAENLRFLVDGEQVSPWETLETMKVVDPEQHWFTVMPKVSAFQ